MLRLASLLFLTFILGCGKDPASNNNTPDGPPAQADAPPLTGDKYSLSWGPITVQPGVENTQCLVLQLSNAEAIKVHQLHNVLSPGSHHMIVYKDDMDTTERTTPFDCQPFTGALNPSGMVAPLMITQKSDDELTLPDGVAHTFAPHQMIRIELHYINASDAPIQLSATAEFYATDPATIHDEADILFIGTPDVSLAAGQSQTIEQFFTPSRASLDLTGSKFFAITGHTHHLGTDMQVSTAATKGATKTSVYAPQPFQWSEPETTFHAPEFSLPSGGGFDFLCSYTNTTNATVRFGESANDEMCFFWAYYYPSKGAHVCFHSDNYGNVDICCPDAGATLCSQFNPPNN
jgi:hypothetical protein